MKKGERKMRKQGLQLAMVLVIGSACGTGWANLIQNGDFETPSPANWTLVTVPNSSGAYQTSGGNPGAYVTIGQTVSCAQDSHYWEQEVNVSPSTLYDISFDYVSPAMQATSVRLDFWTGPGQSGWISNSYVYDSIVWGYCPSLDPTSTWTHREDSFTTPDTANVMTVRLLQNSGWGWASFDNVTITPEPATMGLLAVGGLGCLFRRKR
jgi:hypothetical protein